MKVRSILARLCGDATAADRAAAGDPDDRWSNQYREREKNSIYRWVGVREGGELLAVYEREGEEGVLHFAQEKMESMLYKEGMQSQPIKFVDYVRWRKSVNIALGVTDETTELNEKHSRFTAHEAQWRMNKRGMEGETLVHLLLNRQELVCQEVARILINRYPGLAKDIYLGEELFGQSCLHLAIVHDDYVTAKTLLEYGASVNARANGDFFMPEGFEPGGDHRGMDYEGYAYYGEYPLAFAACFENKDIYDLLIQYGANPDKQDTFGNTISMYSYSARHWHRPAHRLENFAGQTPLTLATKLGRKQIFEEMLELMKVEFWRFSDMTCSAYPLDALDTIRSDGSTNYDSALMTVLAGGTTEHLEMVNSEVIQRLLADKWDAFGRRKLFERLALLVVHLVALGLVVYLRPPNADQLYMQQPEASDWARTGAELLAILCSCWFVFVQQMDELRCNGIRAYLWQTLRFVLISSIFMLPFTETMYFLGKDISTKQSLNALDVDFCLLKYNSTNYDSFFTTFLTLFRICMNAIFYEEIACANYAFVMKTLFVLFTFLMFIMMITLLIAMINNTYSKLIEEAELTWRQQQGQVVMVLERSIDSAQLATYQMEYSVRMNVPGRETRGLKVIKQTTKTRAHQRKQALANWKLIGRKVITMAKELGTQSAMYLLHSHDRLVADDTVGGGSTVPRSSYSTRPFTMFGSNASLAHRPISNNGTREEVEANHQQNPAVDEPAEEVQQQTLTSERTRRPSVPNSQYPMLSIPSMDRHQPLMLFMDKSKLREVVTHATVNNMKLQHAEHEEAQRQKKQILLAGVGHRRKVPGASNLPGMVNVARKKLLTTTSVTSLKSRPLTAGGSVRMAHLNVPQQKVAMKFHQNFKSGGDELLPSVMPNMPGTPPRVYDRRHSGEWSRQQRAVATQKLHSVVAMEPPEEPLDQHDGIFSMTTMPSSTEIFMVPAEHEQVYHQPDQHIELIEMATMPSSTGIPIEYEGQEQHIQQQRNQQNEPNTITPMSSSSSTKKARQLVRRDLFRAKNSPPANSSNSNSRSERAQKKK
ncbi:hypothetical protein GPALN_014920 [Globodera pallida]|nr:hypothetical protein GPALN_014920 [Globodera pallida]